MVRIGELLLDELAAEVRCDLSVKVYYSLPTDELIIIDVEFLAMGTWSILARSFYVKLPIQRFDKDSVRNLAVATNSSLFLNLFYDNMRDRYYIQSFTTRTGNSLLEDGFASHEEVTGSPLNLKELNKAIL